MFTGIISHRSSVVRAAARGGVRIVWFHLPRMVKLAPGASVSVNGICSTVVSNRNGMIEVRYMPETLRRTTAGGFQKGTPLNLEASLRLGAPLDGHIVQGHIDFVGEVREVQRGKSPAHRALRGDSGKQTVLTISHPATYRKFFIEKGSVAVDGVSLTVAKTSRRNFFAVSLIDYTLAHTTLGLLRRGSKVNIESDVLGKYMLNR